MQNFKKKKKDLTILLKMKDKKLMMQYFSNGIKKKYRKCNKKINKYKTYNKKLNNKKIL